MSSPVDAIKARLSIADVIGSYLKLEKAGANFRARCPFHNEKTPSFFVSPARDNFHCFGCGKGGDIFTFVQEIEGTDFRGALEILASKAGIELEPVDPGTRSQTEKLYAILEEATRFYEANLAADKQALDYVHSRGITDESIKKFRIGFVTEGWRGLLDYLKNKGFSPNEMIGAGLVIKSEKDSGNLRETFYDRFRSRVMFPLSDVSGRVVGFSGRIVGANDKELAKYINSPQTDLYDKSRILYGYDRAKVEIKRQDFCVLVEGQMDLVLSHQAGVENTVAVSGTALTDKHLGLIKRLTDNLVMAFDADLAGISASRRALDIAISLGMEVKGALLPEGLDPADMVVKSPPAWREAVGGAKNIIDFYLEILANKKIPPRELNLKVSSEVLPYIARLPNPMDQAHFVAKVSLFLGLKEEPIWEVVNGLKNKLRQDAPVAEQKAIKTVDKLSRLQILEKQIFSLLLWKDKLGLEDPKWQEQVDRFIKILGTDEYDLRNEFYSTDKDRLVMGTELVFSKVENIVEALEELIDNFNKENLRKEKEEVMLKIKEAERSGDAVMLEEYLKKCQTLSRDSKN